MSSWEALDGELPSRKSACLKVASEEGTEMERGGFNGEAELDAGTKERARCPRRAAGLQKRTLFSVYQSILGNHKRHLMSCNTIGD